MKRYAGDPYWLQARRPCACASCGAPIEPGARAFYYPSTKGLYCTGPEQCGETAARDFAAMAADEAMAAW